MLFLSGFELYSRWVPLILGLCYGVFRDQFIFRLTFSREHRISTMSMSAFEERYQRGKLNVIKRKKIYIILSLKVLLTGL